MQPLVAVPAILALLYRAYSRKSLTPIGLVAAAGTAVVHALHPWAVFFTLLGVFFLGGTTVTKVKHDVKSRRTLSSAGGSGGEGARTHVQVFANTLAASALILTYVFVYPGDHTCWAPTVAPPNLITVGIVSNYAAVAADTFASELGILSTSPPRLITSLSLRAVPPGTNGGVTAFGLVASFLGASLIAASALLLVPFCPGVLSSYATAAGYFVAIASWGTLGSVLDSLLGGWLQPTVVDRRTGKVVEGEGGRSVPYRPELPAGKSMTDKERREWAEKEASRVRVSGSEILDNNGVNLLMASLMSVGGMAVAQWWFA